jgi:excisionase family DNA binding protein
VTPELLKLNEAADIARVSRSTIGRAVRGELPNAPPLSATRIGTVILIRRESLMRWLEALESAS